MKNNTIEHTTDLNVTELIGRMALPASVYRSSNGFAGMDCTNGGLSAKENDLLVLCNEGFVKVTKDNLHQVVRVCDRQGHRFVQPVVRNPVNARGLRKDVGPMMGGNFLYTSDSRFSRHVSNQPIAIHDRWDTQEDYDILSR